MDTNKATGPDTIPMKIIKLAANVSDSHLTNIINQGISESTFPRQAKTATVRPGYKKGSRTDVKNYTPCQF